MMPYSFSTNKKHKLGRRLTVNLDDSNNKELV